MDRESTQINLYLNRGCHLVLVEFDNVKMMLQSNHKPALITNGLIL